MTGTHTQRGIISSTARLHIYIQHLVVVVLRGQACLAPYHKYVQPLSLSLLRIYIYIYIATELVKDSYRHYPIHTPRRRGACVCVCVCPYLADDLSSRLSLSTRSLYPAPSNYPCVCVCVCGLLPSSSYLVWVAFILSWLPFFFALSLCVVLSKRVHPLVSRCIPLFFFFFLLFLSFRYSVQSVYQIFFILSLSEIYQKTRPDRQPLIVCVMRLS